MIDDIGSKTFNEQWAKKASEKAQELAKDVSGNELKREWKGKKDKGIGFLSLAGRGGDSLRLYGREINYAYARDVAPENTKFIKIGDEKTRPAFDGAQWFHPHRYKPDIKNIDASIAEMPKKEARFFACKTSHDGQNRYDRPFVWYQNKGLDDVHPLFIKEQLTDMVVNDPRLNAEIYTAFVETVYDKN